MPKPKAPVRGKVVATRTGPVIGCLKIGATGRCQGECSVVTVNGDRLIRQSDNGVMAACTTCWTPRFIGAPTAARMTTTTLPRSIRVDLQRRMKWSQILKGWRDE